MADYQSQFTGQQIDQRLAAVTDKQDRLVSGTNIKTVGGQSILGSGDIPIQADISSDVEDLQTSIETIGNGAFVVAWDGESSPVAANIPAGVSVTYDGSSVTGSLAASASTLGKIYLVAGGTADNYDRYVTVGGSTYSWVHIGNTAVALSDYATNTKVTQLEQKVTEIQGGTEWTEDIDLTSYEQYSVFINNQNKWEAPSNFRCVIIPLTDDVTKVSVEMDGSNGMIAFLRNSSHTVNTTPAFSADYPGRVQILDGASAEYNVPSDAKFLYVATRGTSGVDGRGFYDIVFTKYKSGLVYQDDLEELVGSRRIQPELTYDIIRTSNGEFSTNTGFADRNELVTPRFIKTSKGFSVKAGASCTFSVFHYDADFAYLGKGSDISLTKDVAADVQLEYECAYIKFYLYNSGGMPKTTVELDGYFPDDWDTYNPRPSDSGYHRVSVLVDVTDPTCCDDETSTVQDAAQILPDYGVICLPPQYMNTGKPTRLIIYCHGAAVNYASDVTRFNSVDLDPTFWLAEGYAILDVEGNPFNNTDEHICIPQAMDCYVAAYKWAIEHYNLRRDGVFLGGRSMGGQNTFNLMRRECPIPVIAACPNSAAPDSSFGYLQKVRKQFCALHMGFVEPEGFSWSDGALTNAEAQVLSDNWDKYIKCCPELSACVDLPSKDVILPTYTDAALKRTVWGGLKMRAKCPVKLFGCNQDESCPPADTTSLYYKMLMNSGQIAECRLYNSYKDYTGTGTTAHHYDTQDPALRTTVTTSYGEELTNVPIVYIEMLAFWRRYEQGL